MRKIAEILPLKVKRVNKNRTKKDKIVHKKEVLKISFLLKVNISKSKLTKFTLKKTKLN